MNARVEIVVGLEVVVEELRPVVDDTRGHDGMQEKPYGDEENEQHPAQPRESSLPSDHHVASANVGG